MGFTSRRLPSHRVPVSTATLARQTAEDHERTLEALDVGRGRMMAPPPLRKVATQVGIEYRQIDDGSDWDWFYGLSKAEQGRLRSNWMTRSPDALAPDEVAELMPLEEWLEHTRRADAGRALATGRVLSSDRYGGLEGAHVLGQGERACPTCGHADGDELDVVGMAEISDRLAVKAQTVSVWKLRGVLPEPEWTVGGRPAWRWDTIEAWAAETGRLGYGPEQEAF